MANPRDYDARYANFRVLRRITPSAGRRVTLRLLLVFSALTALILPIYRHRRLGGPVTELSSWLLAAYANFPWSAFLLAFGLILAVFGLLALAIARYARTHPDSD